MGDYITISRRELDALEARANRLARDKSHLQLLMHMMNRLSAVSGVTPMIDATLQIVLDTIGGSNLTLYYYVENTLLGVDVYGTMYGDAGTEDPFVRKVLETRQFIEFEHDFKDTKMLTPAFTRATTWVVPLIVGDDMVGVLKMEGLHIGTRDLQEQLPTFFNYAALLLKNEIAGELRMAKSEERLREKEMLLKEIHHRVKNNLQVVTSLLSLQSQNAPSEEISELFRDSVSRIRSMALVHERLYAKGDLARIEFGEYVKSMINDLLHGIRRHGITCRVEAENVTLGVDKAIPCGLILNELITNALKHAFVGRETGVVAVTFERSGGSRLRLVVSDDGIGVSESIDPRTATSMGFTLINSLVGQISGSMTLERSAGTTWQIDFPA